MSRWLGVVAIVLSACGSNEAAPAAAPTAALASSTLEAPDWLQVACRDTKPERSSDLCFAGADYESSSPGSIFRVRKDGTVATLFQRPAGFLTSYARAPDGAVYFTNGINGTALYRIEGGGEAAVYQHTTYVRMVRIDSKGQVYFNEESGAGGNGRIYKLVDGVAELFYEVDLKTVGGFWGDFGFDGKDRLWLSSSNEIPSRLYLVVDSVPKLVYVSPNTSFMGFRFIAETQILFAGQDKTLRVLDLCSGSVSDVYTVPGALQAQDVNLCPRF